ncbi:TetR/AcrR family transcriptional regulator [Nakamurella endophytica]|uniref:TetR family transcriptional regulator n=1 Tax=Nakamurella endophytica TaxID=1748367 RepID=A0A917WAL4_9ACTN|nr:TetR/AcrR family transcriptional regulator [Nakamurella endophytica]GGL87782.1 TetR family transcriptional regulator [Nakamurella endophytica]
MTRLDGESARTAGGTATSAAPEPAAATTAIPATAAPRPLRADARRNRDALLATAADLFSERGVDVSLEDIARGAGVGIGTLYRHFPTREAVVLAVYQRQIDDLAEAARTLPSTHPPAEALREWMRGFVRYAAVKRGMVALLRSMMDTQTDLFASARTTLRESAGALMRAAADAGEIRADVEPQAILQAMGGICMATDRPGSEASAVALVDLVFDGLRFGVGASA